MLEINKEQVKEGKTAEIYTNLSEMQLHIVDCFRKMWKSQRQLTPDDYILLKYMARKVRAKKKKIKLKSYETEKCSK